MGFSGSDVRPPPSQGDIQRREFLFVLHIKFGALFHQEFHNGVRPAEGGAVEGSVAFVGCGVDVEAEFGAQFDGFERLGLTSANLVVPTHA